jgi:hypothetical protein
VNAQPAVLDAQRQMARLRIALASLTPREIEEALPELELAVASIIELGRALDESGGAENENLAPELAKLAGEVAIVQREADLGLELCRTWALLLVRAEGGYLASGQPGR